MESPITYSTANKTPALDDGVDSTRIADPDQALLDASSDESPSGSHPVEATRIVGPDLGLLAESAVAPTPRKPAIVRRDDLERMRKEREERSKSAEGEPSESGDDFGGSTRIASAQLIENIVDASETEAAASANPTPRGGERLFRR